MKDDNIPTLPGLSLLLAGTFGLVILGALILGARTVEATPANAQKTGKGCPTCHTAPPQLNGTGKKYKQTGKL